jgi:hypothetical protein
MAVFLSTPLIALMNRFVVIRNCSATVPMLGCMKGSTGVCGYGVR